MQVLGLDIGGANIKAATDGADAISVPFDLWREPDRLAEMLKPIMDQFSDTKLLAVTMTAELADCFELKQDGVDRVLRAVESIACGRPIRVWQTSGEFVEPAIAREEPRLTAASNWHAQATFLGRLVPRGSAVLIDIGSTTSDIIPLVNGLPMPEGRTDTERLASRELVYSGVRRTPLCALGECVPLGSRSIALAAELFATTLDVYLLTGEIPEDPLDTATANGRPATQAAAHDRLARTVCADRTEVSLEKVLEMARFFASEQLQRLISAANTVATRLPDRCQTVLVSGSGAFLAKRVAAHAERLMSASVLSLPELFGSRVADCACAFAVAKLAVERELPFCELEEWVLTESCA